MATNSGGGLLSGANPSQLRNKQRQRFIQQALQTGGQSPGASMGAGLASLATALMGGPADNQQVQRAEKMQKARREIQDRVGGVQGLINDPDGERIKAAQDVFNQYGLTREAQRLPLEVAKAQQMQMKPQVTEAELELTKAKEEAAERVDTEVSPLNEPFNEPKTLVKETESGEVDRRAAMTPAQAQTLIDRGYVSAGGAGLEQDGEGGPETFSQPRLMVKRGEDGELMKRTAVTTEEAQQYANQGFNKADSDFFPELGKKETDPTSDLFDERGQIKNEVSQDVMKRAIESVGGTVQVNQATGEISIDATPKQRQRARSIATNAERSILKGNAISTTDAMSQAMEKVGAGPDAPTINMGGEQVKAQPLPQETRDKLMKQNQRIGDILEELEFVKPAADEATGAVSNLKEVWNSTFGQFTEGIPYRDTQKSRQKIRQFNQKIVRSLVNSPRFPQHETERVREMLPRPQSWLQNPDSAVSSLDEIEGFLTRIKERNQEDLDIGQSQGQQQRQQGGQMGREKESDLIYNPETGQLEPK